MTLAVTITPAAPRLIDPKAVSQYQPNHQIRNIEFAFAKTILYYNMIMINTASSIRFISTFRLAANADEASVALLTIPQDASAKLPSRGMVSVEGTLNGSPLLATLEPDDHGNHVLRFDQTARKSFGVEIDQAVTLEIAPAKVDPEPKLPSDLQKALDADPKAKALWQDITTLARREWIHWITSAKQSDTRARRLDQTRSKLKDGKRRPCCFNYLSPVISYEPLP